MSELRVHLASADNGGCGFYRMHEPARIARAMGVEARVTNDVPIKGEQHPGESTPRIYDVTVDADVLVLQRPLNNTFCGVIETAQKKGIAVVVELDDDFENVSPRNLAWQSCQPNITPLANWKWLRRACAMADWVTVSTPSLARYAPHGRVSVLRNRVPAYYLDIPRPSRDGKKPRVGWTGTMQTHPDDLQVTNGMVWRGVEEVGAEFVVIGDGEGVMNALKIPDNAKVGVTGWVALKDYMLYLSLLIDVGIVPLEASNFNNAKSCIKGLEMASLGIPFIASPVDEYRYACMKGLGDIASRPRDWYKHVKKLVVNDDLRAERGAAGREVVRKHFLYEDAGEEWVGAWLSALKHRRQDRRTA